MAVKDGFCVVEVNPPGPVQLYVTPDTAVALRLMVLPVQTGLLEEALELPGMAFTVKVNGLYMADTYKRLTVPLQGSPKLPLVAPRVNEFCPNAAFCTTVKEVAE